MRRAIYCPSCNAVIGGPVERCYHCNADLSQAHFAGTEKPDEESLDHRIVLGFGKATQEPVDLPPPEHN